MLKRSNIFEGDTAVERRAFLPSGRYRAGEE